MSGALTALAYIAAGALWLAAAGLPGDDRTEGVWLGRLAYHLLAALLIRWLYIRSQKPRPSVWSPWLLVMAAGIALLDRLGPSST